MRTKSHKKPQIKFQQSISSHKKSPSSSKYPTKYKISTNPTSLTLKQKIITFLSKASQIQRKLQIIKQTLSQQQTFTPQSLFYRIDIQRKNYILQTDIQKILNQNNIQYKGAQLKLLYGKMNLNHHDPGVPLSQFQNFILPNQNPRLRYYTMRRPIYIPLPNQRLPQKIEWLICKLFQQIMKQEATLKQLNASLISCYDFNPVTLFDLLANLQGFITGASLNNFFQNEGCQVSIQQIGCLMRLIDKHGQGHICIQDFKFFLATMRLKKQHQIFDELSPIPALKNFVEPLLQSISNRQGTLKERVINNKMNGRSPQKGSRLSGKRKISHPGSNSKKKFN